jgi:glycerol uptake facilitator-like aquaporin
MTPTLRRLNDRERYWGLTWPAWIGCATAGALLYGAIRISPFGARATITSVVLLLAFAGMVIAGISGQALSPSRQLRAVLSHRFAPRRFRLSSNVG